MVQNLSTASVIARPFYFWATRARYRITTPASAAINPSSLFAKIYV